jgi:hypothetical protein
MYLKKDEIAYKKECLNEATIELLLKTGFEEVDTLEEKKTRRVKKEE